MPAGQIARIPDTKTRPGGRTERNRQAVADAVLTCIKQGRMDFEIQELAALSGVHRNTISRRWPGRGALMAEAMRKHVGQFSIAFTGDWEMDIRQISQSLFDFFCEPTELAMNRMLAISDNITFQETMVEYWTPMFQTLQEPIRRAKADGLVKPDVDEDLIIIMLSSVLTMYTALIKLPTDHDLPARLADQLIRLCRQTTVPGTERNTRRQRVAEAQG